MDQSHLEVFNEDIGGRSRRVTRFTPGKGGQSRELFHEFDRIVSFSDDTPLDGHVLTLLLYASSLGEPLRVHGAVTRTILHNIDELLMAWSLWKPDRYQVIDVIPDHVLDRPIPLVEPAAIAAFSGGVDGSFTALRHADTAHAVPEAKRYPLRSVLMVHGFDVEVHNIRDFDQLAARVRPFLDSLRLELRTIRTNSRDMRFQDWDDSSSLELAGCLHMFADEFRFGLIGSTKPYDALVLPWGSNPVTDHLMSGNGFAIIHDGAGFSRTAKVTKILHHTVACRTLKVCYAGVDQSENCGVCEKCVRTQLNFLAAGARSLPPCFPDGLNLDLIHTIKIDHEAQFVEHSSLVAFARAHKVAGPWLDLLEGRLATWRPTAASILARQKSGGRWKRLAAQICIRIGLDEPVKRRWRRARRGALKAAARLARLRHAVRLSGVYFGRLWRETGPEQAFKNAVAGIEPANCNLNAAVAGFCAGLAEARPQTGAEGGSFPAGFGDRPDLAPAHDVPPQLPPQIAGQC